jgi:hypothetical protein
MPRRLDTCDAKELWEARLYVGSPLMRESSTAGVNNCTAYLSRKRPCRMLLGRNRKGNSKYRSVVLVPISARRAMAASVATMPSVSARMRMIWGEKRCERGHLRHLCGAVWHELDDHDAIQQINGDAVRRLDVVRAPARQPSREATTGWCSGHGSWRRSRWGRGWTRGRD